MSLVIGNKEIGNERKIKLQFIIKTSLTSGDGNTEIPPGSCVYVCIQVIGKVYFSTVKVMHKIC